jgi:hypothetical protein
MSVDFQQAILRYIPEEEEERCMSSWSTTKGMIITGAGWRERETERNLSLRIALILQFCPQQKVMVRGRAAVWH